ncbi:MAG: hypothetical protein U0228_14200 [Myxococcaceae bacterium]
MNPTGQPFNPMLGPPPPGMNQVRDEVNVPGLLLIVLGALTVLSAMFGLVMTLLLVKDQPDSAPLISDPSVPPALKELLRLTSGASGKVFNIFQNLLGAVFGATMVLGGFQMRNLRTWGLALTGAIVAMMPCSCCCVLGLPLGIWSIVVLIKPEVKASFT